MAMSRYEIRNEYSLADPEIYGGVDKDDPEALLEAVSMAGLVGVLRQLGDLAESVHILLSLSLSLLSLSPSLLSSPLPLSLRLYTSIYVCIDFFIDWLF